MQHSSQICSTVWVHSRSVRSRQRARCKSALLRCVEGADEGRVNRMKAERVKEMERDLSNNRWSTMFDLKRIKNMGHVEVSTQTQNPDGSFLFVPQSILSLMRPAVDTPSLLSTIVSGLPVAPFSALLGVSKYLSLIHI